MLPLGSFLDGTFEVLNDLCERFHQSVFYYLLPRHGYFIMFSKYLPMVLLVVASPAWRAIAGWASQVSDQSSIPPAWSKCRAGGQKAWYLVGVLALCGGLAYGTTMTILSLARSKDGQDIIENWFPETTVLQLLGGALSTVCVTVLALAVHLVQGCTKDTWDQGWYVMSPYTRV